LLVLEIAEVKQLHRTKQQAEKSLGWVDRQRFVAVEELQIEESREDCKVRWSVGVLPDLFDRRCPISARLISVERCGRAHLAK
jgi:hypothetical protein